MRHRKQVEKTQRQEVECKIWHDSIFRHEQETAKLKPRTVSEHKGADKKSHIFPSEVARDQKDLKCQFIIQPGSAGLTKQVVRPLKTGPPLRINESPWRVTILTKISVVSSLFENVFVAVCTPDTNVYTHKLTDFEVRSW